MNINPELYRALGSEAPLEAKAPANDPSPREFDPLLGAEARQPGDYPDAFVVRQKVTREQLREMLEPKPENQTNQRPAYDTAEQVQNSASFLLESHKFEDLVHEMAWEAIRRLAIDLQSVHEMASMACSTSQRNYSDLTNLQEGKALRDSSALLLATADRLAELEKKVEALVAPYVEVRDLSEAQAKALIEAPRGPMQFIPADQPSLTVFHEGKPLLTARGPTMAEVYELALETLVKVFPWTLPEGFTLPNR